MKKLGKVEVSFNGLVPAMAELLNSWVPPRLQNEVAYRNHLLEELRSSLPEDARIEKEYRDRGTTIDLWLEWKGLLFSNELSLELKLDLSKKGEFDRLVGQIEGLKPKENNAIIVLIGDTNPQWTNRLKDMYQSQLDNDLDTQTMAIVEIEPDAQITHNI